MIEDYDDFRFIHYHLRLHETGVLFLFVLEYHYDCEILVIDRVGIHPVLPDGVIGENVAMEEQEITNEIYHDVVGMLHQDGIC